MPLFARAIAVASARRYYQDPTSPPLGPLRYIPRPDSEQPRLVQAWDAERAAREASRDVFAEESEDVELELPPAVPSSSSSSSAAAVATAAAPYRKRRRARQDNDEAPPRKRGTGAHVCDECGRTFSKKSVLATHISTVHAGERPHVCDECGKAFGEKGHLATHISTVHAGERPHVCDECGKAFGEKGHLKKHIAAVHASE